MEKSWSDYISAELLRFSKDQEDSELWVRFQQVHLKGTDILGSSYSFFSFLSRVWWEDLLHTAG